MDKPKKYTVKKKIKFAETGEAESKPSPDYVVGYGKLPKHTQFKPGQSGNPKGKPKGTKHLSTIVKEEVNARIKIKEGGKVKKVTKTEAVIKRQFAKGIQGDNMSATTVLIASTPRTD